MISPVCPQRTLKKELLWNVSKKWYAPSKPGMESSTYHFHCCHPCLVPSEHILMQQHSCAVGLGKETAGLYCMSRT
jgi:hypothetical protein